MGNVKHVGFIVGGSKAFMQLEGTTLTQAYQRKFENVLAMVDASIAENIPIMTFLLLPQEIRDHKQYPLVVDSLVQFIDELRRAPFLSEKQVKIAILGHWYNLPGRLVESVKAAMEETKDYDGFFLNLCLNYDGQQEIVDACKLIGHQVKSGRLDPDVLTVADIKERIYTSAIPPPDLIIKTGVSRKLSGFLLWDCAGADIHITGKPWQEFQVEEFRRIVQDQPQQ